MRFIQAVRNGQRYVYHFEGKESKMPDFPDADVPNIETDVFSSHAGSGVIARVNGHLAVIASPTVVGNKIISFVSNYYLYKIKNNKYVRSYSFVECDENPFADDSDSDESDYEENELTNEIMKFMEPMLKTE